MLIILQNVKLANYIYHDATLSHQTYTSNINRTDSSHHYAAFEYLATTSLTIDSKAVIE